MEKGASFTDILPLITIHSLSGGGDGGDGGDAPAGGVKGKFLRDFHWVESFVVELRRAASQFETASAVGGEPPRQ